jgi:DeoR/GlpR family transcriptional regulator of sugar metabolism
VVETEKRMLEAASEVYVVADHTKFGRRDLAYFCNFDAVATIITDASGVSQPLQKTLENKIKIIIC